MGAYTKQQQQPSASPPIPSVSPPQTRHSVFPQPPPPTCSVQGHNPGVLRGEIRTPCLSVGSIPFGRRPSLYAFISRKLRVVTSPDITFGAAKFQHQKKFWLSEIWPSGLSPGVLIRPAPLQLCALCNDAVRGVPQIVGCAALRIHTAPPRSFLITHNLKIASPGQ